MKSLKEHMDKLIEGLCTDLMYVIAGKYDHSNYDKVQTFSYEIPYSYYLNKTLYEKFKKEIIKAGYRIQSEDKVLNTGCHKLFSVIEDKYALCMEITTPPYIEKKHKPKAKVEKVETPVKEVEKEADK